MARVGVFVCWCGANIAGTVDVKRVAEEASKLPGVVYSTDYKYMCSDPGQEIVRDAIKEHKLNSVVIAACSPRMHEPTFRACVADVGLNPYKLEMANIREHSSWVHSDIEKATAKAIDIVKMAVAKAKELEPLDNIEVPLTKRALVIGGGVAGIQSALDIADGGVEVILVEREPSIGGKMAMLDETFPTLDCSQCILTPKMVDASRHKNITLYTYSEVERVEGYIGNFVVTIRKKARSVDEELCNGCGECTLKCPVKKIPDEFEQGLTTRTAIYFPFPQAVPKIPVIDKENCRYYTEGKCKVCEMVCPRNAIRFDQPDEFIKVEVGAIVLATGYKLFDHSKIEEYGYGEVDDVITGLQFERLSCASGPTGGKIKRPSDGKEPENVVFIGCVGSRDDKYDRPYCSKICCMYTAKHAILLHHRLPSARAFIFYIDVRAGGKGYEEFIQRAMEEAGALYIRGRVSRLYRDGDKVMVLGYDTISGKNIEIPADMVVLATGIEPSSGVIELARNVGVAYDRYGFFVEAHPKLRPVDTNTAGVFLAGCCQAPMDIPDSVAQGSASASKVLALLSRDILEREPMVAVVDEETCSGCFACRDVCPYDAIEEVERKVWIEDKPDIRKVARVNRGKCQGCGTCTTVCRSSAIDIKGTTDLQIFEQIGALIGESSPSVKHKATMGEEKNG
ncbi:MAG: disulfide reductase [Candidatus Coatesbacteria bacterium]|nr:MAG: disulfide reductase [Candidatus Coatesbacteria bacterium]